MRYAAAAILLSAFLLWDAVGNQSEYRHKAQGFYEKALRNIGID